MLLAIGMMANQITTESTVGAANDGADRSQRVADSTLAAQLNLRQMQLAARGIRLARSQSEVEKGAAEARQFAKLEAKDMEAALAIAQRPETRERLQKIKSLMESYTAGTEELAKAQSDLLAQIDKRSAISGEWTKAIEAQLSSSMLEGLPNRPDIEKLLLQADAEPQRHAGLVWRFGATGDVEMLGEIAVAEGTLADALKAARKETDDKEFHGRIDAMESIVKRFLAANQTVVKIEELKSVILAERTVKVVNEAGELMEAAVSTAQNNRHVSKEEVAAATAQANRISLIWRSWW